MSVDIPAVWTVAVRVTHRSICVPRYHYRATAAAEAVVMETLRVAGDWSITAARRRRQMLWDT